MKATSVVTRFVLVAAPVALGSSLIAPAQGAAAVLAWRFIFAIPVVFSALIALALGAALYASRRARS